MHSSQDGSDAMMRSCAIRYAPSSQNGATCSSGEWKAAGLRVPFGVLGAGIPCAGSRWLGGPCLEMRTISGKKSPQSCVAAWSACSAAGCSMRPGVRSAPLLSESGGAAKVSASKSPAPAGAPGGCDRALPAGGGRRRRSVPRGMGGFSASGERAGCCSWRRLSGRGESAEVACSAPPAPGSKFEARATGLGFWYAIRISMGVSPSRWQQSFTLWLSADVHSSTENDVPISRATPWRSARAA
mmetsp:Transcript_142229/g.345654  ORF Transcript_142229/g.345654 Transcript_142229/m.345654 type:complete len:242 (+) Transcript_142229:44-769(+)